MSPDELRAYAAVGGFVLALVIQAILAAAWWRKQGRLDQLGESRHEAIVDKLDTQGTKLDRLDERTRKTDNVVSQHDGRLQALERRAHSSDGARH